MIKRKKDEGHEITLRLTIGRNEADTLNPSKMLFEKIENIFLEKPYEVKVHYNETRFVKPTIEYYLV